MFLTESDREQNDALPVVIDLGRRKRETKAFYQSTVIVSVLSLNFSLLTVIQILTSSVHFCMERMRPGIS